MNKTLKNILWISAIVTIPGAGIVWLLNKLNEHTETVNTKDFRKYVVDNYNRLKVESEKWMQ